MASQTCPGQNGRGDPSFETSISTTKWILCLYIPSTNQCHAASLVWRSQHREERSQLVPSPKHHPGRPRKKQASFHSDSAHDEVKLERVAPRRNLLIPPRPLPGPQAQEPPEST